MHDRAWLTYLSNSSYLDGCLVLAYSLRKVRSRYPLVVMVPASPPLQPSDLEQLAKVSNIVIHPIDVSFWKPPKAASPSLQSSSSDKEDGDEYLWDYYVHTWAKLGAWGLIEYKRLVLMDCDMLVRINMDQLLNERPTLTAITKDWVAAAHACTCNPMQNPKYPA
ncbi:nucleotide-diphospho-sugar transferase, partial [Dissophora ornata]